MAMENGKTIQCNSLYQPNIIQQCSDSKFNTTISHLKLLMQKFTKTNHQRIVLQE